MENEENKNIIVMTEEEARKLNLLNDNADNGVTYVQNFGDGFYVISRGKPYKRKWYKVLIEVIFKLIGIIAPIALIIYGVSSAIK
jgi:hypothetical protein